MPKASGAAPAKRRERPDKKICKECVQELPITAFYHSATWICPRCIPCEKRRSADNYRRHREARRAQQRVAYWRDPEKHRERWRARQKTAETRARNYQAVKRWQAKHPEKLAAHRAVRAAIRRGDIGQPTVCSEPGCAATKDLARHHPNYARPLEFVVLCRIHHEAAHHRPATVVEPAVVEAIRPRRRREPVPQGDLFTSL